MSNKDLRSKFTVLQIKRLNSAKFFDVYSFITYFPYSLVKVTPLTNFRNLESKEQIYLFNGLLKSISHRSGKQRFLVLDFSGQTDMRCYLFKVAPYVLKNLQIGNSYQLLLVYNSSGLWVVDKFAILKQPLVDQNILVLGQAKLRDYLVPKYRKVAELKDNNFHNLHRRLELNDYKLDLSGLVPIDSILPQSLDLSSIHKPISQEIYNSTLQKWVAFKVYLRLVLLKYLDIRSQNALAKSGQIDIEFLRSMVSKLPFELSHSQKTVIWSILKEALETT
ncbi:MAG: hypothetical protein AAGF07_02440 [Patescibacteria group bacterium]